MALSLKISNVIGNELELIQRLKKVNSPGKKALLVALKNSNYSAIYKELLFRIELYTESKVLNYTRQDLNTFVTSLRKVGIDLVVTELVKKYVPVAQQVFIEEQEVTVDDITNNKELQELIEEIYAPYVDEISLEDFTELCEYGMESFTDHSDIKEILSNEDEGFYGVIQDIQSHELAEQFEESGDDEVLQGVYSFLIQYFDLK